MSTHIKLEDGNVKTNDDLMTEKRRVHGGNVTGGAACEEMYLYEKPYTEVKILANKSKLKRHIKAVKQYLTRKEWKKGDKAVVWWSYKRKPTEQRRGLEKERKREKQRAFRCWQNIS